MLSISFFRYLNGSKIEGIGMHLHNAAYTYQFPVVEDSH